VVVFLILLGIVLVVVGILAFRGRTPTALDQAQEKYRQARLAVDDIFHEARVRMEEATGHRRPGERKLTDGMRGSWRDL